MIDIIINSFKGLDTYLWISQISGLIGLLLIGIAYQLKRKNLLLFCTLSFVFFILEQLFASLYANLIVSSVCFLRNLTMYIYYLKKEKELPKYVLISFLGVLYISEIILFSFTNGFTKWDNYLPIIMVTMSTFTQNSSNELIVKIGAFIHEGGFLIYYLVYALPLSIFRQALLVASAFISIIIIIIKYYINKNKEKKMKPKDI